MMKHAAVVIVATIAFGQVQVARCATQKRRRFTPQAVVVAKQKLAEIANVSTKRRADVIDTLEMLFTDYGLDAPRAAASDVLDGSYEHFKTLHRNDRLALAQVVANVVELFPEQTGMAGQLRDKLPILAKLQNDPIPNVAKRAQALIRVANGKSVDYSKKAVAKMVHSFMKSGRDGLTSELDRQLPKLLENVSALELLATDKSPLVAERAKFLLEIAHGGLSALTEDREDSTIHLINSFLQRGRSALMDLRSAQTTVIMQLADRLPELELLSEDVNPVVAGRARSLIAIVEKGTEPIEGVLNSLVATAYIKHGPPGLVDYLEITEGRMARLAAKLPELMELSNDEDAEVAGRAKWLVEVSRTGVIPPRRKHAFLEYSSAFFLHGREGLLDKNPVGEGQKRELALRLPELHELSRDPDKLVAQRAKWLIKVVNGDEIPERRWNTLAQFIRSFRARGRAGLLDPEELSAAQIAALRGKIVELERLATGEDTSVAKRANAIIRMANGQDTPGYKRLSVVKMARAFLRKGSLGLDKRSWRPAAFRKGQHEGISARRLDMLVENRREIEGLADDEDAVVAARAQVLLRIIDGKPTGFGKSWESKLVTAFLTRGRAGLLDDRVVSPLRVEALVEKLPELEALSRDDDYGVAEGAKLLIRVAKGETDLGLQGSTLGTRTAAFLKRGRAGLKDYKGQGRAGLLESKGGGEL